MSSLEKKVVWWTQFLCSVTLLVYARFAGAYPSVVIQSVRSASLEGPIHHGIVVETSGIDDPNLSHYEVQIKPDSGGPFPPWKVYSAEVQPFDPKIINVPYRNGTLSLQKDQTYCVKVRAVYGPTVTSWAESCGVKLDVPPTSSNDTDADSLSDDEELALGTDPLDPDSDWDGVPDGVEVAQGSDPNHAIYANLIVRTPSIDFGLGEPLGRRQNQHQVVILENAGEELAQIQEIRLIEDSSSGAFHLGDYPKTLTAIPPQDRIYLPVSFLPTQNGPATAKLEVLSNSLEPIEPVTLEGIGTGIPDCEVTPAVIDFGTVAVNDQAVAVQKVTITNREGDGGNEAVWGFTLSTTDPEMAPGIRAFILAPGEEIKAPIFFQHSTVGDHSGFLEIRSAVCSLLRVELKGVAE